jgi:hypothetical protein
MLPGWPHLSGIQREEGHLGLPINRAKERLAESVKLNFVESAIAAKVGIESGSDVRRFAA